MTWNITKTLDMQLSSQQNFYKSRCMWHVEVRPNQTLVSNFAKQKRHVHYISDILGR